MLSKPKEETTHQVTIKTRYLYLGVYLIFLVLFILILYKPIVNNFSEADSGWIITAMSQHTEQIRS